MKKRFIIFILLTLSLFGANAQNLFSGELSHDEIQLKKILDEAALKTQSYEFIEAINRLNLAAELSKKYDLPVVEAIVNYSFAKLYIKIRNYNRAHHNLEESIIQFKKIGSHPKQLSFAYLLHARVDFQTGKLERAEKWLDTLETIKDKPEIVNHLSDFYRGIILMKNGNYAESSVYLRGVPEQKLAKEDKDLLSELYLYKAKLYYRLDKVDQAISFAQKSLKVASGNQSLYLKPEIFDELSIMYTKIGNQDLALKYADESNIYRDSLVYATSQMLAELSSDALSTTAAADTISELSLTNSKQERSLKFNQLAVILSVLLISILSLLTLSFYKNNNIRAKANKLLQEKNTELLTAKEKAEAAKKSKEQFLSTVTHELRTPIYAITGLTYLLINENPTKQQREHLSSLKYSGEHLLSLINNILDLNKLEAKKVKKVNSDFSLKAHMKNFFNTLKRPADDKNVSLKLDIDDNIPDKLNGDMLKVSQVLINLVSNAIKFSENGTVWIRVILEEETNDTAKIKFEVEDNGIGVPKNMQDKIFQSFDQGDPAINIRYGGTGLGLPIVKNLLLFLGSKIHLKSEEGVGSLFHFSIAFHKSTNSIKKIRNNIDLKKTSEAQQLAVFSGKKILIVEDNALNQKITRKILERKNIVCEIAENGEIAVEKTKKTTYDLILMDVHMPVMDGIEATKIIRKNDSSTPIIALTAVSLNEEVDQFLKHGFTDFIPKPYKTELFFEKLFKVLNVSVQAY
ncbi:response regulator [Haloflavibacter putidus]|nr:response regulator [Haloflavibacter putidus]